LTIETLDLDALERLWERIQLPLGNALGPAEEFALSGRALIQRLRWAELDRERLIQRLAALEATGNGD